MESATPRSDGTHLAVINALRGIAALSVCWFHVSGLLPSAPATLIGRYGFMGVQVFFVVSGFVIPYALHRGHYQLSMLGRFLAKRMLRLHPPYITVVAVLAASRWIANTAGLHPYAITGPQVLAHLAYLNAILGLPWLLDSFWTLAIEFQYYLAISLLFRLLARRGWATTLAIAATSGAASMLLPSGDYLPHYLPFFALGIAAFRRLSLKVSLSETLLLLATATVFGQITYGTIAALVGLTTAILILFAAYSNRILDALGNISYSLYLTHPLLTSIVITQGRSLITDDPSAQTVLLTAAVAASVLGAWPLYRFVELPSKRWAASIPYKSPAVY